jgi:hypothetical protein
METLYLLSNGDIYQMDYDDIKHIFNNHFISSRMKGRNGKGMVSESSNHAIHIKIEIGGLLKDMKMNIFHYLAMQMDSSKGSYHIHLAIYLANLLDVLKINIVSFAWDYKDMKGIDPSICIHHIYIKEYYRPVRQPQ